MPAVPKMMNIFSRLEYLEMGMFSELDATRALKYILINAWMKVPYSRSIYFDRLNIDHDVLEESRQVINGEPYPYC